MIHKILARCPLTLSLSPTQLGEREKELIFIVRRYRSVMPKVAL